MGLLDYLIKTFGYNEPILLEEISYKDYSKPWIFKELSNLCEGGKLVRFEKGVYYIPKDTLLGPSKLNPQKLIEKKYIKNGDEQLGYYSGASFLNQIGLSTQVPNVVEIYTNNESSKAREITVGGIKVILRRPRKIIDKSNVAVQSFLELMNSVTPSFFNEERRKIALAFIKECNVTRSDITSYASFFPDKAMKTLVESELIYSVIQ